MLNYQDVCGTPISGQAVASTSCQEVDLVGEGGYTIFRPGVLLNERPLIHQGQRCLAADHQGFVRIPCHLTPEQMEKAETKGGY